MMYQLGGYQFEELQTAAPQSYTRTVEYRWAGHNRIGQRPSKQFIGVGEESITFEGVIFPEFIRNIWQVEEMRQQAATGTPFPLVRGDGTFFGLYCIERVEETGESMIAEGVPLKQTFRLELKHYGRDQYART